MCNGITAKETVCRLLSVAIPPLRVSLVVCAAINTAQVYIICDVMCNVICYAISDVIRYAIFNVICYAIFNVICYATVSPGKCTFYPLYSCRAVAVTGRPGCSEVPRNPLTRWDVSSIPANGIFRTKNLKNKNKNAPRVENDYHTVSTQNSTSRSTRERNG